MHFQMRKFRPEFFSEKWAIPSLQHLNLSDCQNLDLEIGAGVGWHAIRYAQQNPDRHLLALEHGAARFSRFQRRIDAHPKIPNLTPLQRSLIPFICADAAHLRFKKIFLLYPNPYPKNAQKNKRFHAMPFFGELLKKLDVGGLIEVRTNEEFYAAEAKEFLCRVWSLELKQNEVFNKLQRPDYQVQTHFEQKYFNQGQDLHRMLFRKCAANVV